MMKWFKIWWPLLTFILVWLLCGLVLMFLNYDSTKTCLVNFIASWDVASSVALSILAFIAYYQHAKERNRESKFLKELERAKELSAEYTRGAIVIQIGGGNLNALNEGTHYASVTLRIPDGLIAHKKFGDEKNKIDFLHNPKSGSKVALVGYGKI